MSLLRCLPALKRCCVHSNRIVIRASVIPVMYKAFSWAWDVLASVDGNDTPFGFGAGSTTTALQSDGMSTATTYLNMVIRPNSLQPGQYVFILTASSLSNTADGTVKWTNGSAAVELALFAPPAHGALAVSPSSGAGLKS